MKISDKESTDEKIYRQNILLEHTTKSVPVILFLLIPLAVAFVFLWVATSNIEVEQYGNGDPYHCSECKELNIACKEHRGYNPSDELQKEIQTFSMNYTPDGNNQETLYGKDNYYNKECDFCIKGNEECYGCKYERERISSLIDTVTNDEIFISKLCDKCWGLKYANCSNCRAMLVEETKKLIK